MLHVNIKKIFNRFSVKYTHNRAKVLNFFLKRPKPSSLKEIKKILG